MNTLLLVTGAVIAVPAIAAASAIWKGYVLSVLWSWFVVPFFGLPALSIPLAIGIAILASMLTHTNTHDLAKDPKRKKGGAAFFEAIMIATLTPALALLVGWITKAFL